ncbi:MAG: metallophosphoesterase [Dorea sp.]
MIVLVLLENFRELQNFQTTFYQISSPKLAKLQEEKRVLFLSDLHNRSYGKDNKKLLDEIEKLHPDCILIGGDMLVRKDGNSYDGTVAFLAKLPDICPVYYANGNHEQKLKELPEQYAQSYETYKEQLVKAGIHFLENESSVWNPDGARIRITGLEIPLSGYRHFGTENLPVSVITERVGDSQSGYQILLAHNPDYVKEYQAWGADLILCGHYHGGVARIPGIGGVIAPNFRLFPRYSGGIYREKDAITVVSRGLGTHSVPIRILNPPELIVLEFSGDNA